jgi:hypothetical protein
MMDHVKLLKHVLRKVKEGDTRRKEKRNISSYGTIAYP